VDKNWILIDDETGLHVGWYFWLRLLDEANRSARYGNPFGLLMLQGDFAGLNERQQCEELAGVARAIRSTDVGGRLNHSKAGVILLEQDAESAETAAERISKRLGAEASARWTSQLYCYPQDAAAISNLLTQGRAEIERTEMPA
jgi:GGDEF domain-containing protein